MNKSIALLSGKGGSGKTTFALTIANMLVSCGIKVLLIDCDLFTNGATYFFEDRMNDKSTKLTTFYDILNSHGDVDWFNPLNISDYFDFIPSIRRVTDFSAISATYSESIAKHIRNYFEQIYYIYEAVIFDCPAGYSEIIKYVSSFVDQNLVILEADAVSAAAMRSLYLKLGSILSDIKVYQLFNKIRKEEVPVYSKIDGTFFTNIGTLTFNWEVRKSFSIGEVPNAETAGVDYMLQLFQICETLFKGNGLLESLQGYNAQLMLVKAKNERKQKRYELLEYRSRQHLPQKVTKAMFLLIPLLLLMVLLISELKPEIVGFSVAEKDIFITILTMMIPVLIIIPQYMKVFEDSKERQLKINTYQKVLDDLDVTIADLEKKLEKN